MVETFARFSVPRLFSVSRRTVPAEPGRRGPANRPGPSKRASKAPSKEILGGLGSGFTLQRRFDPFFHETLFEMFNRAGSYAQGFGYVGYLPRTAVWSRITQQANAPRMDKLGGRRFFHCASTPSNWPRSSSVSVTLLSWLSIPPSFTTEQGASICAI